MLCLPNALIGVISESHGPLVLSMSGMTEVLLLHDGAQVPLQLSLLCRVCNTVDQTRYTWIPRLASFHPFDSVTYDRDENSRSRIQFIKSVYERIALCPR